MPDTVSEFKLDYSVVDESGSVAALIVAAGSSSRMKGINKLFAPLLGIPVLARTLLAFEKSGDIDKIIIAAAEKNIADVEKLCVEYNISKLTDIVQGGETRMESVLAAAKAADGSDYFAIHDGARPLISSEVIKRTVSAARIYGAAAPGVPLKDTVKRVNKELFVLDTLKRDELIAVQTPQVIRAEIFLPLINIACSIGSAATDDCSLVEETGREVKIVEGDYKNIKITTPVDIAVAEVMLLKKSD